MLTLDPDVATVLSGNKQVNDLLRANIRRRRHAGWRQYCTPLSRHYLENALSGFRFKQCRELRSRLQLFDKAASDIVGLPERACQKIGI